MEPQWGGEKSLTAAQRKTTLSRIECARSKQVGLNAETKKGVGIEPTGEIFLLTFTLIGRFCDEQPGHSFYPFCCYPGPLARSWRRPFHSCGVPYPQAPTSDLESLPTTIAEFMHLGPHPRRLDGALGASHSSAPFRNRSEAFDTAWP